MKKKLIIIVVLFVLGFGAWKGYDVLWGEKNGKMEYAIEKVTKGDLAVSLSIDGKISIDRWDLDFLGEGTVDELRVKLGDVVTKGQVLATLKDDKIASQLAGAKADLNSSQLDSERLSKSGVDYKIKKEAYEAAKEKLEAEEDLYDEYESEEGEDSTQALAQKVKVKSAQADVENAKRQLQQVEESYKDAQYMVSKSSSTYSGFAVQADDYKIISPISGAVVAKINGTEGTGVKSGGSNSSQTGEESFMVLANSDSYWFEAEVEDAEALKIMPGTKAYMTLDAYPDDKIEGEVAFVSPVAEIDENELASYRVVIVVKNPEMKFLSDMAGTADLVFKEVKDVLIIPNSAVKTSQGKQKVIVKSGESFSEREIQTGFTDGKKSEVKSGLNQGEEVVIVK